MYLHVDFTFCEIEIFLAFFSILDVIHLSSRFPFTFPRHNKRLPLDIITFLFSQLKLQNNIYYWVKVNEDGALENSSKFNKLLE